MDFEALQANFQPVQFNKPRPQKKKRNFWLDQLSTVGGIAGGIGGSFIAPIAGTAVGAGAGGALGEAIENIIDPEGGNWGNVAKEGALSSVMGAGPIKLAKAGLQTGAKVVGKKAIGEAGEVTLRTASERGAQHMLGNAWGFKTGAKVGASKPLTPQTAQQLQRFVSKEVGVPKTASADMVAERLVNFRKLAGSNIDDIVKSSDRTLSPAEQSGLVNAVTGKISKLAGVDPASPSSQRLLQQMGESKSISDLIKFRRSLDDTINFARNEISPDPTMERVSVALRGEIDKITSKLVPGLKSANTSYSQASQALNYVLPNANKPRGINIFNNRIAGGMTQRGEATIGQARMNLAERAKRPITNTPKGIATRLGATGLIKGAANQPQDLESAILETQSPQNMLSTNNMPTMMKNAPTSSNIMGQQYQTGQQMSSGSPYSRENLLSDLQRDPQNAQKYIEYYAQLDAIFNPQAEEPKPLGGEAQKRSLTAQSGLRSLDTLEQTAQSDPGAFQRQALPNPFGITARFTGTTDVRAATDNIVDVIARLRSGAAITDEEAARFARLLPQPGDSQESAMRKLMNVRMELESFANPGSGGLSLEDAMMQYAQ